MQDPIMAKSSSHGAVAPITVRPSGLYCEAELWLTKDAGTTKAATSGLVSFTSSGTAQSVSFSLTMPSAWGSYQIYIDVYADGMLIGAYVATDLVSIPDVSIGEPEWT